MKNLLKILLLLISTGIEAFIVPKLLLPYYDQIQVNYTINAEEGCYKWRSLNSEIASIKPIPDHHNEECTSSAIVFVESRMPSRKITLILAESDLSGTVLQCDVIIDRIQTIDIISRTRELYLEDPPETLKIRALDSEGNTFSSTAGMLFEWSLVHDTEAQTDDGDPMVMPAHTILSIKKFIDTMYNAEAYVEQLERADMQSDTILLSGLQTGNAFVVAQLISMMDVQMARIRLTVRDKVFLIPSGDVWLPQYAAIRYVVEQWRSGKSTEIKMPNTQYFLQLNESNPKDPIVTLDAQTSVAFGLRVGDIQLFLMDKNLKQQTIQASSDIHVTEPAYLKFLIQPNGRWVLETGRHYTIHILMYDSDNHRLWPANNIRITANIDSHHFKVTESSKNGTWHSVYAVKKGEPEIYAKLNGILKLNGELKQYDPVIEAKQIAEIFDPITVIPPIVVFPWQPDPVLYKYQFSAEGGSGNYTWSIDSMEFAMISNAGIVMTKIGTSWLKEHQTGSAVVRASDVRNPDHWGSSNVLILPVVEISFDRSHREAQTGTFLDVYLMMLTILNTGEDLVPVVDCRDSGVTWNILDESIFELIHFKVDIPGPFSKDSCIGQRLKALREGHTTLTASYRQTNFDGTSVLLKSSITIASFSPLKAIDPPELAVVSLDSSKVLRFEGGPNRWPHWHAGYERTAVCDDARLLEISNVQSSKNEHHVASHCLRFGEAEVKLLVRNKPCNTNPLPVQVTINVRVSCTVPLRIELEVPPMLPSCPLHSTHAVQTVALINRQLLVNVTAFDAEGNVFDNFTSVLIDWNTNEPSTSFDRSYNYFTPVDDTDQRKHIVNKVIGLPNIEGELTINAALTRYHQTTDDRICKFSNCSKLEPIVTGSVVIMIVTEPSLSPSQLTLYNHINSSKEIHTFGGSSHFHHRIKQDGNSTAIIENKNNVLKVYSHRAGKSHIQMTDKCLTSVAMVTADVVVSEVGRLDLKAPPRMELQSWSEASLRISDNFDHDMPAQFLTFINIQLTMNVPDIIMTDTVHAAPGKNLLILSDINANNVGSTTLTAVATLRDGRIIRSNAVHIVVFPPLELLPQIVTLIRHASYQLVIRGGPRSDFVIEYIISDESRPSIVNVSHSGVVHALQLGNVTVTARAVMHDGAMFYCKTPTKVKVVQMTGIRIIAPLTQFHVGGIIPLHVAGITDDERNPFSFGSAVPGLIFKWEIANPSVAELLTVHAKAGIHTNPTMRFTMLVEGISVGHSTVSVYVTSHDKSLNQLSQPQFHAELLIKVFDPLSLVSTVGKQRSSRNNFLMTLSSTHQLQTNRDGVAQHVNYAVLQEVQCNLCATNVKECILVDHKGFVTAHHNQCETTVLVTAVERFGINQTLALHVLVRPVAYIIAKATTIFHTRGEFDDITSFPLSSSIRFVVDQYDDSGDKFDATSQDVLLHQNRYDLIEVEPDSGNRSFIVKTPLEGSTIISVASYMESASNPSAIYYFPINVKSAITPKQQKLTIGSKFCFKSEFINEDGTDGVWSTSNPTALLVDGNTGAVIATTATSTMLTHTVDSFVASALVTMQPFVAYFIEENIPKYIIENKESYILPIKLTPGYMNMDLSKCDGLDKELPIIAHKLFHCSIKLKLSDDDFFYAETEYIAKLDSYACVISHKSLTKEENMKIASSEDSVIVKLEAKSPKLGSIRNGIINFPFIPSFVSELSSNTLRAGSHAILCIKANPTVHESLQIISDPNMLEIIEESRTMSGSYCYKVTARQVDVATITTSIRITSKLTTQDERIDISLEKIDGKVMLGSSCPPEQSAWRGSTTDVVVDSYIAYVTTAAVVVISTAMLIAAFSAFKWVTSNTVHQSSSSFLSRTPPPYDASSMSPVPRSSPGSTPKPRLWSRYYQPQQPSPGT